MTTPTPAERLRVLVLDVDGVLTDGRIGYGPDAQEIKFFDVRDGLGVKLLQAAGIQVGVLSGRGSLANRHRARELRLDFALEGQADKWTALETLLRDLGCSPAECAYLGDDLIDVPVLRRVGLAVAVADAVPEVLAVAHRVTTRPGGRGAVRELAEWWLRESGRWQEVVARYEV